MTISLDFAPGTTDASKRVVQQLSPNDLFDAYRLGRHTYSTGDLVLVVSARDPESVDAWPRVKYVEQALRRNNRAQLATVTLAHKSAHKIMLLPAESDAFWLVVETEQLPMPIMCVLHAVRVEKQGDTMIVQN